MARWSLRHAMVATVLGSLLASAAAAGAATEAVVTDEIGGGSVAARATAQGLQSAWATQVAASGGTPEAPMRLTQPTFTNGAPVAGIINTAADGTTTSVSRTQYTGGSSPAYVGVSPNPGTASCTRAGSALQGSAPRPTSLVSNATCSTAEGFGYAEQGGVGESTTRDAVEFGFSRPVLGFGAWFGDLETRTDGNGVAALVRLYGADGALLSEQAVQPGPSYLPQSACGGRSTGCGNNTTRWIGFVADPAEPVTRMVVIVGDNNVGGNALNGGLSFIGPTLDLSTATISLDKTARPLADTDGDGVIGAGDTIQYDFAVTNTGSLPVSAVSITDPSATGLTCSSGPLAAGDTAACTGTHALTQEEVDSGSFSNTAIAEATAYAGTIASEPSTAIVPIPAKPGLTLTKTVEEPTYAAVGDVLNFQVEATNTGNLTLTGLTVVDPPPGSGAFTSSCPALPGGLAPTESATCSVAYTVTQDDLEAGSVTNVASARAWSPDGGPLQAPDAEATSTAVIRPGLSIVKTVDEPTFAAVGEVLHYEVSLTNIGNVAVRDVAVTDAPPGPGAFDLDCSALPTTLAAGASGSCAATYTVTQADLDEGQVVNSAQGSALLPDDQSVESPVAAASSVAQQSAALSLVKSSDTATYASVGDVLTYTLTLTNAGNVTLTDATVLDPAPGDGAFELDCSAVLARLSPGETGSCTATYAVTQDDLDAGTVTNVSSATATSPGQPVVAPVSEVTATAAQTPSITATKSVDAETFDAAGDILNYSVVVTNNGNVTLSELAVTDLAPGNGVFVLDCDEVPTSLPPGATGSCAAKYTVLRQDLDAGQVANTAAVDATAPTGPISVVTSPATSIAQTTDAPPVATPPGSSPGPIPPVSPAGVTPSVTPPDAEGNLPDTGAGDFRFAALIGLALVCAGAWLVTRGRRRRTGIAQA